MKLLFFIRTRIPFIFSILKVQILSYSFWGFDLTAYGFSSIPPLFVVPPTIKSSGLSERAVVKYKPVTLQCIANGIPNPSITWLKDDQPVNTAKGNLKVSLSIT